MAQRPDPSSDRSLVVRESQAVWAGVWVGFPVLGALAGWGLVAIAGWVTSLPWAPMQGPFELVERYSGTWTTIGVAAAGAVVGLLLALTGAGERLTVRVDAGAVHLERDGSTTSYGRGRVSAAAQDDKELVLLARDGTELAREKHDLPKAKLADAFRQSGVTWFDADPHRGDFRPWVEDTDGLPPGANAVLRARAAAVKDGKATVAHELRQELYRLGVAVRDRDKRQSWRLAGRDHHAG